MANDMLKEAASMKLEGRRVLVTGGAGFIGSQLVRLLSDARATVIAVDNLRNGRRENLVGVSPNLVELVVADIRDRDRMETLLRGVSLVFHLACLGVRHSIHSPHENHEVNATATLDLLAACRRAGVERFVYVSTSEVYGTARSVPMTEEHPTFPMTVYGAAKLAGEGYTRAYHSTYGFPTVVIRPFNAYGPRCHHEGDSGEVIPKFLLRCLAGMPMIVFGDGNQTRDFTFVSDTARAILLAGVANGVEGCTINVGQGSEVSINELAARIRTVTGRPDAELTYDEPRPGDVLRLYSDSSKAASLLGFKPSVPLAEGLTRLLDWYRSLDAPPAELLESEIVHNWESASNAKHGN
jgi:UDP-glucose 4-epimerase